MVSPDRPRPPAVPPPQPPNPVAPHREWQRKHEATMIQRPDRSPVPGDPGRAAAEIRGWVTAERRPASEAERLVPANPDGREHNFRVSYVVNYALRQAGAVPGRDYPPARWQALAERALWTVTTLRQSDARIGTSESLVLRDAQRYLYGTLGDAWLQRHVVRHYHVPPEVARRAPAEVIDRGYEGVVKPAEMAYNAASEELTGRNPGLGRGKAGFPHSRPGGEAWFDRGVARRADHVAPFLLTVPETARRAETAAELAAPPGHVDLGHGESVNLETGRYTPGFGPKL
jgi:hypothetical protein